MKVFCFKFLSFQLVVIFFVLCLQASRGEAQADAPMIVGTWKLNLAKSKFESGPPLKSRILTWEWDGETLKYTAESVNADGVHNGARFSAKFDGKDYPVFDSKTDFKVPARYLRLKRIDAYTLEMVNTKAMRTYRHVVSRDGKTDTHTRTITTAEGQDAVDVLVYDRQ